MIDPFLEPYQDTFYLEHSVEGRRENSYLFGNAVGMILAPTNVLDVGGCLGDVGGGILEMRRLAGRQCSVTVLEMQHTIDSAVRLGIRNKDPGIRWVTDDLRVGGWSMRINPAMAIHPTPFDCVICTEVAEHLPPDAGERLVQEICWLKPDNVVWTAAEQEQGGTGHINCCPSEHWEDFFHRFGYHTNAVLAGKINKTTAGKCHWALFYERVFVYSRNSP